LLRTFKRWHDYLYGNQQMRHDKAFWQLLYLIFCKILDEQQSSRLFFVGATEASNERGRRAILAAARRQAGDSPIFQRLGSANRRVRVSRQRQRPRPGDRNTTVFL
jgi:hypothetical protein